MKSQKRFTFLILFFIFTFGFYSCGDEDSETEIYSHDVTIFNRTDDPLEISYQIYTYCSSFSLSKNCKETETIVIDPESSDVITIESTDEYLFAFEAVYNDVVERFTLTANQDSISVAEDDFDL